MDELTQVTYRLKGKPYKFIGGMNAAWTVCNSLMGRPDVTRLKIGPAVDVPVKIGCCRIPKRI